MLTVTQKIASEADAEAILNASYGLSAPLGIPTLILDPADYPAETSFWRAVIKGDTIEKRVMKKLERVLYQFYGDAHQPTEDFLKNPNRFCTALMNTLETSMRDNWMAAHSSCYESLFNVVICPRTPDTGTKLLKYGLKMRDQDIPDMPGYDAQWNFIKLWHEFAHGLVGPSEAQADHISGHISQFIFEDPKPLMVLADFRAAQAILFHDREISLNVRGWPLVETMDAVLDAPAPATWASATAISKQDLTTDTFIPDVQYIGRSLRKISRVAFEEPDLLMLGMMSDHMANRGNVENEAQLRIARRFAIAAQRLSIGTNAYAATQPKFSL